MISLLKRVLKLGFQLLPSSVEGNFAAAGQISSENQNELEFVIQRVN